MRSKLIASFLFIGLLAAQLRAVEPADLLPDLTIALGETNQGNGLQVPSGGDGANAAEAIKGVAVRRKEGRNGGFMYVVIGHPAYDGKGPRDLYVVVELFDDAAGSLSLQYDKAAPEPNIATKYTASEQTQMLFKTGQWRKVTFYLPQARLGHGENGGADFRLSGANAAIRSIAVTPRKPAGFDPAAPLDAEARRALQVDRPPGMELTFGNDATAAQAALYQPLSVTSVESYVDWAGVEPEENHWDWSKWDKQVAILKAAGLKWVPFLIAGPAYATPLWFQKGPHSHYYRCLEHGEESRIQTIFNPEFRPYVERFLQAFADRYRDSGVIESVLLGSTGAYGESLYPAGETGGWTARLTGTYHNHAGWWAGDSLAVASFRAAVQAKYGSLAALNTAWGTQYGSFDEVTTFLPDKAPSDPARMDFVTWYEQSMTEWATFWVRATRKALPQTEIYLCTGGNGLPRLGADFTAQAAAIAPFGAGVRITNEGSNYAFNFTLTREVATVTRFYGTFCGFEPAAGVNAIGVAARIYNATASGARQLHYYNDNVMGSPDKVQSFRANAPLLAPRHPQVDVAFYLARESWALDNGSIDRCYRQSQKLRALVDHDYVTRKSVADGILKSYRALVLTEATVLDPKAAETIEQWVQSGGVLVAVAKDASVIGNRYYNDAVWRERMFHALSAAAVGNEPRIGRIGKGWVVLAEPSTSTTQPLTELFTHTLAHLAGVQPLAPRGGQTEGKFITETREGPVMLDTTTGMIEAAK